MEKKQILTIKDCMSRHGKSYDVIAALFKRKGSPAFRVGREWQVDAERWEQYLMKLADSDKG
ncbi:hypothetical protein ACOAOT_23690 [Lacrimispora sp. AGF001]|uniref:hypothetical protein n=1 Tax=Lacrimispora sp. AGF001 TaxID=3401631 RepID=UPI003B433A42